MKDYHIELMNSLPRDVDVSFTCPHCGCASTVRLDMRSDEDWHTQQIFCENPDEEHKFTAVMFMGEYGLCGRLEGHPDVNVSLSMSDPIGVLWGEPEPEPDAYGIFLQAMADWKSNVRELGTPHGASSRNRMLFVTLYSIMEAYLSDAIIGAAMEDVAVQRKMLKLDGLKDKQVSLETILDKPDIVRDMVKTTLHGLSFHNLGAVNGICGSCLGKQILPREKEDRALVMKSIDKRHDCVHRNGNTKAGMLHDDITREYLDQLGEMFEEMAKTLFDAIRIVQADKFFEDLDRKEAEGE